ncbi:tRNA lysidine(34) synthetase TilS [Mycoplasmopsis felifaucium]|uniref:tRNA lysidine(34) synthetase TilS n=1 Tax=Mycoplasmopsis felifaucium TaxID=35768 RepID=UPI00048559A9|nr:tRNA lysidine(34) synthetase TilS [Mycoplasmopsis felifaucium]
MYLLGISGGPDSMFLLEYMSRKYPKQIIVATVNYNVRENSDYDSNLVKEYCNNKDIPFYLLEVPKNTYKTGNFEEWARKIRFDFFREKYVEHNCESLVLAHHKDDFIESAIMQKRSGRKMLYYGIKSQNIVENMHVWRPFVDKFYKSEILEFLRNNNIEYALDYTNDEPICTRNQIRLELKNKTFLEKETLFQEINNENDELYLKQGEIELEFSIWKQNSYEQKIFNDLKFQKELVYKFIHQNYNHINLRSNKIESIIKFITSKNRTAKYLLKNNTYLIKKHGKLLI